MTPAYYEKYSSIVQGLETLGLIFTNPNKYYNDIEEQLIKLERDTSVLK